MIYDSALTFSSAQAITASAVSTNSVDLSKARNIGVGSDLYVVAVVTTAFTDSGSDTTLQIDLQGSAASNFGSPTSQTIGIFAALSAAGTVLVGKVSPGLAGNLRYLQGNYTIANGSLSTGAITVFLTHDPDQYTSYAKNYTVS